MTFYYILIVLSTVLFGANFVCNDLYRKDRGSSLLVSLEFTLISSAISLLVFLAMNGFRFECTPFIVIMAFLSALNGFGFTFFSLKSLGVINLSLYSLFSMLGGMMIPFLQGIIFYGEAVTVANLICFVLIILALLLTVERKDKKRGGTVYYIGVFVLNGMSGVLAKIYNTAPFDKGSAEIAPVSYFVMSGFITVALCGALLTYFYSRGETITSVMSLKSTLVCGASGVLNRVANYILIIALMHVPSSVQYPMVTGGVMIVSTLACFIMKNKPSKKEIISVLIAFVALVILVIPALNIELFNIKL